MKRLVSLFLAAALCLTLAGCASSDKQKLKDTLDEANGYTTVDYTMKDGTTLDQTVIYDKNGLVVTALGLEGSVDSCYLTVRLENNTSAKVQLYISGVQVNGWETSSSLWKDVSKNSMGRWSMYLYNNMEWDSIQTIQMECELMDGDYDTIDTFTVTLETSAYTGELTNTELPGDVLYEGDGITLTFGGFQQERYSSYTKMQFYVENTRSSSVTLEGEGFRLADGRELDASLYEVVSAGAKDAFYIYVDQDDIYDPEMVEYYDDDYYGYEEDDETFDWTALMPFEIDLSAYQNYSTLLFTTTVTIDTTAVEIVDEDEAADWGEETVTDTEEADIAIAEEEPIDEEAANVMDDTDTAAQEDTTTVTDDAETAAEGDTDAAAAEEETVTAVTEDVRTA